MAAAADHGGMDAHPPLEAPAPLVRRVRASPSTAGPTWLASLPDRVRTCVRRWDLTVDRVQVPGGRDSMVVQVTLADSTPATLKIGRDRAAVGLEGAALEQWNGWGAARRLAADPEVGALLLERLRADVSLRSLAEPKALLEAADTVRRLWVPVAGAHPFPSVAESTAAVAAELRSAQRAGGPGSVDIGPLVGQALEVWARLLAEPAEEVLLHGRYQQGRVLAGERARWLAVGPRPAVGERAFDLAWLVRDRLATLMAVPRAAATARRRVAKLADSLEVAPDRLAGWTLFRSVAAGVRALRRGDEAAGELLLEFAGWLDTR